jgi:hypothetical protein
LGILRTEIRDKGPFETAGLVPATFKDTVDGAEAGEERSEGLRIDFSGDLADVEVRRGSVIAFGRVADEDGRGGEDVVGGIPGRGHEGRHQHGRVEERGECRA